MSAADPQLVSVGIPTYNRSRSVERAVRSVLAQDHPAVEVVVADNASGDDTQAVLERLAAEDPRVRFTRNPSNLGHVANFNRVLEMAQGDWFMWLSDDDWIEPGYVSACLAALRADPSLVLACGRARYYDGERFVVQERATNLTSGSPAARVAGFFSRVDLNGPFYGVGRREDRALTPFEEVIGGDWLVVGGIAARGAIRTVEGVHINRSHVGVSSDAGSFAREEFGLRGLFARSHHVLIARTVFGRVARGEGMFARVGPAPVRAVVALVSAAAILLRFTGLDVARLVLGKLRLLPAARRLIAPLRERGHR